MKNTERLTLNKNACARAEEPSGKIDGVKRRLDRLTELCEVALNEINENWGLIEAIENSITHMETHMDEDAGFSRPAVALMPEALTIYEKIDYIKVLLERIIENSREQNVMLMDILNEKL